MSCAWTERTPSSEEKRALIASSTAASAFGLVGDRRAAEAEHADLDPAVERHVGDGRRLDERERREAHAGRQPQASPLRWHRGAELVERLHRIAHEPAVDRGDQRVASDGGDVRGRDQPAVVAGAAAEPRHEQVRRPADHERQRDEDEQRRVRAGRVGRSPVGAHGGEALAGDLDVDDAGVVDRRPLALDEAAGERHRTGLQPDGQPAQVELPRRWGREPVERGDDAEVVDLDG